MASIVLSFFGLVFVLIGLVPLFGWLNWIGIIFLFAGLISGVSGYRKNPVNKLLALVGTLLCIVFLIVAVVRLCMGGGIL